MFRAVAAFWILAVPAGIQAQDDDPAELKRKILEKVRQKLAEDRSALLRRVEKIIDEELGKDGRAQAVKPPAAPPPAAPSDNAEVRELEKKLKALEEQREALQAELSRARRQAEDEAVRKEALREGPNDLIEAQALFQEALAAHEAKDFKKSIRLFKRIYYQFPEEEIGYTSAYNVACGYALAGKTEEALDWLELAVKKGFDHFDHMRKDPDLDSLRGERRYKKLLIDK